MPVRHSVIHKIDKKPDGTQAVLFLGVSEQVDSQARDDLMSQLNESYNATAGKGWGFFHQESGAYPFSGWLGKYLAGITDFLSFSTTAVEHLTARIAMGYQRSALILQKPSSTQSEPTAPGTGFLVAPSATGPVRSTATRCATSTMFAVFAALTALS